ncbi:LysR family transcriptional regulator [Spirillospora sp. CA-294931]|uniref:LysR family transcriptional regulator n=1 Tax=Spirillospora sp. CA-294931 TaxID=3240042 RepID=UPI003D8E19BE
MELRHARAFLVLAEERHFGRAAQRLHIAQPALSHQIKMLEREVGVTLFDRTTRRVELTAAGRRFDDHARRMLGCADHAVADMRRVATGQVGRVSAGFIGTATYDVLPRVAREVHRELPGIDLRLRGELLSPQLLDGLIDFEFDLVVHRPEGAPRQGVRTMPLRTERLVAVLPAHHPLAASADLDLRRLADEPFVVHPAGGRSSMHELVLAACAAAGFRPAPLTEVAETATLVVFVAAGLGVALVPEPVRALGLDGVAYVPLTDAPEAGLAMSIREDEPSGATRNIAAIVRRRFA